MNDSASSRVSTLCRFITKYTFEKDAIATDRDLICLICNKLMVDACQSACGCQYCYNCINSFLKESPKFCPGSKEECKEQHLLMDRDVLRNRCMNNRIYKLPVRCPNEKCQSTIVLGQLEEHLRLCEEKQLQCPYTAMGCENDGSDIDVIVAHLHDDAFTHARLLIDWVYNMKNETDGLKEELELKKSEVSSEKEDSGVLAREFVEYMKVKMAEIMARVESQCSEIEYLMEDARKKEVVILRLEKNAGEKETKIEALEEQLIDLRQLVEVKWCKERSSSIASTVDIPYKRSLKGDCKYNIEMKKMPVDGETGVVCYTIDRYSLKKANKETFRSPYFYSHTNGYKLRLRVDPGGYTCDTHMSVFFVICKGEHDNVLPWPCRHTFTVGIVNQRDNTFCSTMKFEYSLTEDCNKCLFDKPINRDNKGCGHCKFISHAELESVADFIAGDSVVMRCVITAPP